MTIHPISQTFELTEDLVKLLRSSYVCRNLSRDEYGAAEIDPKRPYGNSDVADDIAELLGWEIPEHGSDVYEAFEARAKAIHQQTPTALQVVLSAGSFETGTYIRIPYSSWARLEVIEP